MSTLELDWTLRQPKDAPWCWPAELFYPCGCNQDDWSYDEDGPYECDECHPLQVYLHERDRRVQHGRPSARHQFYTDWLRRNGWIQSSLADVLKAFYLPAIKEQLNSSVLLTTLLP